MIVAAYRILYGHDYLKYSLSSIAAHVDKIAVFWQRGIWNSAESKAIQWSDELRSRANYLQLKAMAAVSQWERESIQPVHQWPGGAANRPDRDVPVMLGAIQDFWPAVDRVLFVEPDEVWDPLNLSAVLCYAQRPGANVCVRRRDYWHGKDYWIDPPNPHWSMKCINVAGGRAIGETTFDGRERNAPMTKCHGYLAHFAYAQSPDVVRVKHDICQYLENTPQHADWYERVWLLWTIKNGPHKNLCPVVGHEDALAEVKRADASQLPEVMQ